MITITACLIVKDEAKVLARCLDSIKNLVEEIIIVDTGSTDQTKAIAGRYTSKIYDFTWIDDFSAARNFSFEKASMDYIYVADADEVIEEEEQRKFLELKQLLPKEVEVVQMLYSNQFAFNTTYNFDREYRPKLYKRQRSCIWIDPVHESVRLEPVIFDSEICIKHMPVSSHAGRDFAIFERVLKKGLGLSKKLWRMYAKELFIGGEANDFLNAGPLFLSYMNQENISEEENIICQCVIVKYARLAEDSNLFFKTCLKNVAVEKPSSEVCFELGEYFLSQKDFTEATIWFYNAAFETSPELNIRYAGDYPRTMLAKCYKLLGNQVEADEYTKLAKEWKAE